MEAGAAVGCLAFVLAFFAAFLGCMVLINALRQGRRSLRAKSELGGSVGLGSLLVRNGVPVLRPCAKWLLHSSLVRRFSSRMVRVIGWRGVTCDEDAVLSLVLAVCLLVGVVGGIIADSWVFSVVGFCLVPLGCSSWASSCQDKRRESFRDSIPDAIKSMEACFLVGYTLPQTLRQVGETTKGPLGELFEESASVFDAGGTTTEALRALKRGSADAELNFLATALEIQHRTGSSMQQVLEVARVSIAQEMEMRRNLKTQTAQARLSARIVTIMPFALMAIFSVFSEGFLDPFFESVAGMALLMFALLLQISGVLMVRKLLDVEVD